MTLETEFIPLPLDRLRDYAHRMKDEGWRFIQTHAATRGDDVDLYYSFMKDGKVANYRIEGVLGQPVPSITDIFLAAFVFENEARELFGVDMRDIAIDFQGGLYAPAESEPMRFITPEQKAAIDKARNKAAKASEGQAATAQSEEKQAAGSFKLTPEKQAKLEEKLKDMDPAKAEKVRAALAAKMAASAAQADAPAVSAEKAPEQPAKAAQTGAEDANLPAPEADQVDADLESKLSMMDPDKAAKVRAAMAAKKGIATGGGENAVVEVAQEGMPEIDVEVAEKLSMMDAAKAQAVRRALANRKSSKGGE